MQSRFDQRNPYRFQTLAGMLATSRSASFLRSFAGPHRPYEVEIQTALADLFTRRIATLEEGQKLEDSPILRSEVEEAISATPVGANAGDVVDWIDDLPDSSGTRGLSCTFYWNAILREPQHPEDRDGPPEVPTAKWRSLRAAGEERPRDAPDPDPLKKAACAYVRDSAGLRSLRKDIKDWQKGPFTDLDLSMAEQFDWSVADGLMWSPWEAAVDYALTKLLWATFHDDFTVAERDAILAWKVGHIREMRGEMADDPNYHGLTDAIISDPPCHPDDMLRTNA